MAAQQPLGLPPGFVPRVIVKFKEDAAPDYRDDPLDDEEWKRLAEQYPGIRLQRLFTTVTPERIRELQKLAQRNNKDQQHPDFLTYFAIVGMPLDQAPKVTEQVSKWERVESAYVDPPCTNPCADPDYIGALIDGHAASGSEVYLAAVKAPFAWRFPGGAGQGQHLVDLEMGWQFCHRDLQAHFSVAGSPLLGGINRVGYRDHGTKVLGIICGHPPQNAVESGAPCCIGITPCLASVKVISYATGAAAAAEACVGPAPAGGPIARNDAVMQAVSHLQALGGGVLLLEAEVGSTEAGVWGAWARSDHPIEIIPTDLAQIRLARDVGVVVVEAAGNAGADLDEYEDALGRHPLRLRVPDPANPDSTIPNRDFQDSGAIMVGAARQTLQYKSPSNYGSRVNCFAWGERVFSTNLNNTYTSLFNGTSSASAIIAGVALSVLGLIAGNGLPSRTPQQIRELLSDSTYGRLSFPGSRPIGSMPDLAKIARDALGLR
jgi:hypothetical protein